MRNAWRHLDDDLKRRLEQSAKTVHFPKGALLFAQGAPPSDSLYRIEKGEVELRLFLGAEDEVVGMRREGDWISLSGVFPNRPNPFNAIAVTDLTVTAYPMELLRDEFYKSAAFAGAVASEMDESLAMMHKHLSNKHATKAMEKIETFPFRKRVREIMKSPVRTCSNEATAEQGAKLMNEKKVTSLVIVGREGEAVGIVTEKDIVKNIAAQTQNWKTPIGEIGSAPVKGITPSAYIYQAIYMMRRFNIRHLPALEGGKAVGMITMRDLMHLRSHDMFSLIAAIEEEADPRELDRMRRKAVPIFRAMLEENIPPLEISGIISHINAEVHHRAVLLALDEMGPPPVDFSFFVTGSHGRRENHLQSDQDHGIILDSYPAERHNEIDKYFMPLSEKICDNLHQAGLPYCDGEVMCRNPVWRKTLPEWKGQLKIWLSDTDKTKVRYLTLLADIALVYGSNALFTGFRHVFYETMKKSSHALRALYEEAAEHKAPLGLFKRIITEKDEKHKGEVDLKKSGIIFMVEALRILAIRYGIEVPSCAGRLDALIEKGVISTDDGEFLLSSYQDLFYFLLRTQLRKLAKGVAPDTYIKVYLLTEHDKETVKNALKSVQRMQSILHSEFGNTFL